MPKSKAAQRATDKWNAKTYDKLTIWVPRGRRETIAAAAAARGLSSAGYIAALVCADLHLTAEEWKARTEEEEEDGRQGDG